MCYLLQLVEVGNSVIYNYNSLLFLKISFLACTLLQPSYDVNSSDALKNSLSSEMCHRVMKQKSK